jgi:hypothetical protein
VRHRQWAAHWRYSRAVPFARCRGTNLPGLNGRNALMLCSVGGVLHSPSATHLPRRSYPGALGLNAPGYFVRLTLTPCRWERDLLSMSCEMRASIPLPASRVDPGPIDAASWDRGFDSVIRRRQAVTSDMSLSNGAPCLCAPRSYCHSPRHDRRRNQPGADCRRLGDPRDANRSGNASRGATAHVALADSLALPLEIILRDEGRGGHPPA